MDIFLIGGSGFISGRVTRLLLSRGHSVTVLTRGTRAVPQAQGLEHVRGDRNDAASLKEAVSGRTFDVVYDIIAYEPEHSRTAVEVFRGRTERFIHCSTVSVYMVSDAVRCPIAEDQDKLPLMAHWPRNPFGMDYGINKRLCEDVLWKAHEQGVFHVSMLRPTYVCGPDDPSIRDWFWIQRILDGGPLLVPGSGDHAFQLVYIDDVAQAFVDVLETPDSSGKAYNVAGEDILTMNEYLHRTAALLNREVELVHVDQSVFDKLPFSTHSRGDVFPFNTRRTAVFSLDRIKRDTGYRSMPFDEWMGRTIDWYRRDFGSDSVGYDSRDAEIRFVETWKARKSDEYRRILNDGV